MPTINDLEKKFNQLIDRLEALEDLISAISEGIEDKYDQACRDMKIVKTKLEYLVSKIEKKVSKK